MRRMKRTLSMLVVIALFVGCDKFNKPQKGAKGPTAPPANTKKLTIGKQGAHIHLEDSWQRKNLNPDFGNDQFVLADKGFFGLAIIEIQAPFDTDLEFQATIDEWTGGFKLVGKNVNVERRPLTQTNGLNHASARIAITVQGMSLNYEAHILGRDGLNFLFLSWTSQSKAPQLLAKIRAITQSLTFPGPNSEWARSTQLRESKVTSREYTFKFPFQKSIFSEVREGHDNEFHALTSHGGQTQCYWFFVDGFEDIDEVQEGILSVIQPDYPDIKLKSRDDIRVAERDALQTVYQLDDPDTQLSIVSTVVPLADNTFLEIRCNTLAPLEGKLKYLKPIINQLVIDAPSVVDAFPGVAVKQEPEKLSPEEQKMIKAAKQLGAFESAISTYSMSPDGSILGIGSNVITKLERGKSKAESLIQYETWKPGRSTAYAEGQLLAADGTGDVAAIEDGVESPFEFKANMLSTLDESRILIVRTAEIPDRLQLLDRTIRNTQSQLYLRKPNGDERELGQFQAIEQLAASLSGDFVLVHERINFDDSRLVRVDVKTGSHANIPGWKTITHVAAGSEGWLVNGQPEDGLAGLYLVKKDDQRELLISGPAFTGVRISNETLVCASLLAPNESVGSRHIYSIPLDVVRGSGPGCRPFDGRLLQKIAEQTVDELKLNIDDSSVLATKEQVEAFLKKANEVSRQVAGHPLPVDPATFDRVVGGIGDSESLSKEGLLLLSLNLAACLFESGAEWVDSDRSVLAIRHGRSPSPDGNKPFAIAYMVDDIILSTLYDGDGWWDPAQSIVSAAGGRTILLGGDPEKIRKEHESRNGDALDSLIKKGDTDSLLKFLKDHADNVHLRQRVYDSLVENGQIDVCTTLAGTFAKLPDPKQLDVKYQVVLEFQNNLHQSHPKAFIRQLRTHIEQFPLEPVFYLVLGAAYEASDEDAKLEKARRCYAKVIELRRWGSVFQQASDALSRLDDRSAAE